MDDYLIIVLLNLVCLVSGLTTHIHNASFVPDSILRISARNVSIGGIQRYSTVINGTILGPVLKLPEGKVVWIRVYNDLPDRNATMHWHGLSQAAYPFSDGTPLASQWPIPPGHFFDYELSLPKDSAGTYFYHSHVGFQANTASGPLIIEDSGIKPYKTDDERIFHIQELFNLTDIQAEKDLTSTPLVWPGETQGFMVNGKTISNWAATDTSSMKRDVISVTPSKTYRFRFIGGTTLSYGSMGFENHTGLQVIEADGTYTQPVSTDILQLGAGQRFSLLFKAKSCDQLKRAKKLDYYFQVESRERQSVVTNYAILRYDNTCGIPPRFAGRLPMSSYPKTVPVHLPPTINGFLDYKLQPLNPDPAPTSAEVTRRVIINVQQFENGWYQWRDDGVAWVDDPTDPLNHTTPYEPYLVALYKNQTRYLPDYNAALANGGVDPKTQTFPAKMGEVLEIVLQNIGSVSYDGQQGGMLDAHPWHAHGGHYYDIGAGPGAWSAEEMERKLAGTTPLKRDTTMLYRYQDSTKAGELSGWRAWRLRVEDPGVWMIHCHWLQHMIQGMQTVWVFGDAKDIMEVPTPQVRGYLEYGGSVYGNSTHAPEVVHFSEL